MAGCWSFFAGKVRGKRTGVPSWVVVNQEVLERYSIGEMLGRGAYGVVIAGVEQASGRDVAVKFFDRSRLSSTNMQSEVALLKCMRHRNIVRCIESICDTRHPCLVMERFAGGDLVEGLQRCMKDADRVPGEGFAHIGTQLAAALRYLHSFNIVHRDVKSDNVMLDRQDIADPEIRIALGDFGVARAIGDGERLVEAAGTKMFWAPEFYALNYGIKVDVWAMGVVMYSLLVGRFPFRDEVEVRRREASYPRRLSQDARDYLKVMLRKAEARRASAEEVLSHPWLGHSGEQALDEDAPSSSSSFSEWAAGDEDNVTPANAIKGRPSSRKPTEHAGSMASTFAVDRSPSVSTKQGSDVLSDTASVADVTAASPPPAEPPAARVCGAALLGSGRDERFREGPLVVAL